MDRIINHLKEDKRKEILGLKKHFIEKCIVRRMQEKNFQEIDSYYQYLLQDKEELGQLINHLNIPVSQFFRDPAVFEMIYRCYLSRLVKKKKNKEEDHLRIWSAGCSTGEEPYSLAILLQELLKREDIDFQIDIFATDIDEKVLGFAKEGLYDYESVKNTRYEWIKKYFKKQGDLYSISNMIKNNVCFSIHDLRDEKNIVPPESIFGYFDLVFCRNVLIYYDLDAQRKILKNLFKSITPDGLLALGEAESILLEHQVKARRLFRYYPMYKKSNDSTSV